MPLTIAAVAFLGWGLAGMTLGGAILLGAVLAPTDPVLAGDLQIGPPLEGKENPVRFALTTEAGLNDGLAFPFVYLALHIASQGADPAAWLALEALQDHAIKDCPQVQAGPRHHEAMPQDVVEMQPFPQVKDDTGGVGDSSCEDQPERS